jgi:uncharacterized protein YjeT (DUF2065 family)
MARIGLILAAFGIVYLLKPNIYRRWFWKKTDIMQQKLSLENYTRYMRITGAIFLVIGLVLMFIGKFKF